MGSQSRWATCSEASRRCWMRLGHRLSNQDVSAQSRRLTGLLELWQTAAVSCLQVNHTSLVQAGGAFARHDGVQTARARDLAFPVQTKGAVGRRFALKIRL